MEMSHRSKAFEEIIQTAEQDIRDLLKIPDNYKVLFWYRVGSPAVCGSPVKPFLKNRVGDYIITGQWAKKAWKEAKLYGTRNAIASSEDKTFSYIPDCSDLPVDEMPIMFISAKIIRSTEQNSTHSRIQRKNTRL